MIEFRTEKINDRITRIRGVMDEYMYLVVGAERAALLDTGSGFGSLKALVDNLTDTPVTVLISHGHVDHAMGAAEFNDVYMNREDEYIYNRHGERDFRLSEVKNSPISESFDDRDYVETAPLSHFHDLKDGMSFDLGGLHIDVYACPGHTRGSLVFLIREDRVLMSGDAANDATFLFGDYSLSVDIYRDNLIRLNKKIGGKFDRVLTCHHSGEVGASVIDGLITVCDEILAGRSDDIPFPFHGTLGFIAKKMQPPQMIRLDGGVGNLIFSAREKMSILVHLAESGDPKAQALLGNGYLTGQAGKVDLSLAEKWSRLAAEQGEPMAMTNLGIILKKSEPQRALGSFLASAEKGYFKAYRYIGLVYELTEPAKAVIAFRQGAEMGDITSQYHMGRCYENGIGVQRDYAEAYKWYQLSSERGDRVASDGMVGLAGLYERGLGVDMDMKKAKEWYEKAARAGNKTAKDKLREL